MTRAATARESEVHIILPRHAIIGLMRAADGARRAMTRTLQPFDLTLPQFNVLTILRFNDALPTFQVAARMVEATPGITRLMITLEAKGYISRSQSAGDRRQQLCSLTVAGAKVVDAAIPRVKAAQERLLRDLSRPEALQLTGLLRRVPAPGGPDRRLDYLGDEVPVPGSASTGLGRRRTSGARQR
jgi:DNA-binding MarR family transcriptional regulator